MTLLAASFRRRLGLAMLLLGTFMGMLDLFIVNIAAPSIQADLRTGFGQVQLVIAAYDLAYATGLVVGGRLGDAFGARRVFLLGTAAFVVTSGACAAAPTAELLIFSRTLQGLTAALMLPQVLSLVQQMFDGPARTRAISAYSAVIGLAAIAGQVAGGVLLWLDPADLGWRSVFLVNVPLGVLTLAGVAATVPAVRHRERLRLDLLGAVLLGAALLAVLYPLADPGSELVDVGLMACAPILLFAFIWWEVRLDRSGGDALLPPRLLTQRGIRWGIPTALFFYGGNAAFTFLLQFHLQANLGLRPIEAALIFTPMAAASATGSLLAGRWVPRYGHRVTLLGAGVAAAGLVLTATATGAVGALPGAVAYGFGGGIVVPSIVGLALAGTRPSDAGTASGSLLTVTQVANAVGIVGVGALFTALPLDGAAAFGPTVGVLAAILLMASGCLWQLCRQPALSHGGGRRSG